MLTLYFKLKILTFTKLNTSLLGMNTRQQNKLHILLVRLSSIQRGVHYSSVKIFNQLPQNIFKFHNNVRIFLVKDALYSPEEFYICVLFFLCLLLYLILQCKCMNIYILLVSLFCNAYVVLNYCVLMIFFLLLYFYLYYVIL